MHGQQNVQNPPPEEQLSRAMFHAIFTKHWNSNFIVLLLHQIMLKSIQS